MLIYQLAQFILRGDLFLPRDDLDICAPLRDSFRGRCSLLLSRSFDKRNKFYFFSANFFLALFWQIILPKQSQNLARIMQKKHHPLAAASP